MENMFKDLQKKISEYEKVLNNDENISINVASVNKIEGEISEIEEKIEKLKENLEEKSKIEQMKATLNITSLESEITLKKMDLEDAKKEANKIYENTMNEHKERIETQKNEIKIFIDENEKKLQEAIKEDKTSSLILNTDFEEIKGYYKNIIVVENNALTSIEKELSTLRNLIKSEEEKIKSKKEEAERYLYQGTSLAKQVPTSFFGDISTERIVEHQERMNEAFKENGRLLEIAAKMRVKLEPIKKEEERLVIRKDTANKKLENIDTMIEEMIKELIQEELKKREIAIPDFVECGKYFKVEE